MCYVVDHAFRSVVMSKKQCCFFAVFFSQREALALIHVFVALPLLTELSTSIVLHVY